ncbi:unnamed protein product, partial [marine sediment metagenome]
GSLLLEPATTNAFTYSNDFSQTAWTKDGIDSPPPSGFDFPSDDEPDGGWRMQETATSEKHRVYRTGAWGADDRTVSIYVKPDERTLFYIGNSTSSVGAYFNLTDGTVANIVDGVGKPVVAGIETFTDGWFRCWVTHKTDAGTSTLEFMPTTSTSSTTYTGDGTSGLFISSIQREDGQTYPTTYIPTLAATVNRGIDTGIATQPNDALYTDNEGTLFFEGRMVNDTDPVFSSWGLSDSASQNRATLYYQDTRIRC